MFELKYVQHLDILTRIYQNFQKRGFRKIMNMWIDFFYLTGRICLLYFLFIIIYVGPRLSFHYVWLAAGVFMCCMGRGLESGKWFLIPEMLRMCLILLSAAGLILLLVMEVLVFTGMRVTPKNPVKYVIVLGACVRGTRVTRSLSYRLKKAAAYAGEHQDCMLVVSGGQGPGEDITEAEAMSTYLQRLGIPRERILMEDRSVNTRENLLFSKRVICRYEQLLSDGEEQLQSVREEQLSVAVCSNNFHMYRAMALARSVGEWKIEGLAAMTDPFMWLSFTVREGAALFKELLFRHISRR